MDLNQSQISGQLAHDNSVSRQQVTTKPQNQSCPEDERDQGEKITSFFRLKLNQLLSVHQYVRKLFNFRLYRQKNRAIYEKQKEANDANFDKLQKKIKSKSTESKELFAAILQKIIQAKNMDLIFQLLQNCQPQQRKDYWSKIGDYSFQLELSHMLYWHQVQQAASKDRFYQSQEIRNQLNYSKIQIAQQEQSNASYYEICQDIQKQYDYLFNNGQKDDEVISQEPIIPRKKKGMVDKY